MSYIDPAVITDETAVAAAILAAIADQIPGWEAQEGSPETSLAEAIAVVEATIATLIAEGARDNYSGFGQRVLKIPRGAASPSTGVTTWTFAANPSGLTIPAGTEVVFVAPVTGDPVAFATLGDHAVAAGVTVAAGIPVASIEAGSETNGCTGDAAEWDEISPGVANVEMTSASANGKDEEDLEVYVGRVADRAKRLHAVPVTADDYAAFATDTPGVARAVAINLLDPDNPPAGSDPPASDGFISICAVDAAGVAVAGAVLTALTASFATDDRPFAAKVRFIAPTLTGITAAVQCRLDENVDPVETLAAVEAAITARFAKSTFGVDASLGGKWRLPTTLERTIRAFDIAQAAETVVGVLGVTSATVNGGASVTLTGRVPLPNLTSVTATEAT